MQYSFIFSMDGKDRWWVRTEDGKGKGRGWGSQKKKKKEMGEGKRKFQRAFWVDTLVEFQHEKCSINICWMNLPKTSGHLLDILNACAIMRCIWQFLNLSTTDVLSQITLLWGLLAAPQTSTHQMPVAPPHTYIHIPQAVTTQSICRRCQLSPGDESSLVENYQ